MSPSLLATINLIALLFLSCFLADAMARAQWRQSGNGGVAFLIILCGQAWLIPQAISFFGFHSARLLYPLWFGNWIVTAAGAIVLPLTFRRQSSDLFNSAQLDGAGALAIFQHVIWPTAKLALLALGFLLVMATWTEFAQPLFAALGSSPVPAFADCTVPTAPRDLAILIGASLVATLPAIVLYLFVKRALHGPREKARPQPDDPAKTK
jgi:ABC-type glycerol-3-phosphate transport system permease component